MQQQPFSRNVTDVVAVVQVVVVVVGSDRSDTTCHRNFLCNAPQCHTNRRVAGAMDRSMTISTRRTHAWVVMAMSAMDIVEMMRARFLGQRRCRLGRECNTMQFAYWNEEH